MLDNIKHLDMKFCTVTVITMTHGLNCKCSTNKTPFKELSMGFILPLAISKSLVPLYLHGCSGTITGHILRLTVQKDLHMRYSQVSNAHGIFLHMY